MAKYKSHRAVHVKEAYRFYKYGNGKYPKLSKPLIYVFLVLCALPFVLIILSLL